MCVFVLWLKSWMAPDIARLRLLQTIHAIHIGQDIRAILQHLLWLMLLMVVMSIMTTDQCTLLLTHEQLMILAHWVLRHVIGAVGEHLLISILDILVLTVVGHVLLVLLKLLRWLAIGHLILIDTTRNWCR